MVNRVGTRSPLLAQLTKNQGQTKSSNSDAVPAGYKRTEVGVVPVDWEVASFGEVFRYLRTGSNSRADLNDHGDVYYIHYGDLHTKKHPHFLDLFSDRLPRINSEKVKSLPHLQDGDIIISDASEDFEGIGVSVELRNTTEHPIVGGLHTIALRDDRNRIAKGYGGYLTAIPAVKDQLIRNSTGTTVYGLSKINLSKTYFPLPPTLPEQRAIATALGDTDALLAALDALIAKQERVKRGVLEELLGGERRLAGFSSAAASGGDGEWVKSTVGECFSFFGTSNYSRAKMSSEGPVGCVHYGDIHTRLGTHYNHALDTLPKVSHIQATGYTTVQDGDVIFSDASEDFEGIGMMVEFNNIGNSTIIGGLHTFLLRPDANKIAKGFTGFLSQHPDIKKQLIEKSTGTTVYGISKDSLRSVNLNLPPLPEQRAIAEVLSALDAELAAVRARRAKVARVKAGMMEALLTGRVRLV